jgi:hypothetical protein
MMKKQFHCFVLMVIFAAGVVGCAAEYTQPVTALTDTIPPTNTIIPSETVTLPPPTATHTPNPSPTIPLPTPTLSPSLTSLQIAFVDDDRQIWLWENETIRPLTNSNLEGYVQVKISDDGSLIAFSSNSELWVINSDGSNERLLVSADVFQSLEPRDPGVGLSQFDWISGTHTLMFNTILLYDFGLAYTDDLYRVNADTLRWKMLRQPGEGGKFIFSPDGKRVLLVTPHTISLMQVDGSDYRNMLEYYVETDSEYHYYAKPVWEPDSQSLIVAIPPNAYSDRPTISIWRLYVDSTPSEIISQFQVGEGVDDPKYWHWSPDMEHYATFSDDDHRFYLASNRVILESLTEPTSSIWFSWIDETHFFYRGYCSLRLGTIGAPSITIVDSSMIGTCVENFDFTK